MTKKSYADCRTRHICKTTGHFESHFTFSKHALSTFDYSTWSRLLLLFKKLVMGPSIFSKVMCIKIGRQMKLSLCLYNTTSMYELGLAHHTYVVGQYLDVSRCISSFDKNQVKLSCSVHITSSL